MTTCHAPTLDDLLADPLVVTLMSADHVDAASLKRDMTQTAARIVARRLDLKRARFALPLAPVYSACGIGLCG